MTDVILIRNLRIEARVGVTDREKAVTRPVIVNLEIATDLERASKSDDLADTLNYDALASEVADAVRSSEANLIEHLAGRIAEVLSAKKDVTRVTVEVIKPSPPTREEVESVAVKIERRRT